MTSLPGRFERDVLFLGKGEIPLENSGREVPHLDYSGEEHEKLSDRDVCRLSEALCANNKFVGSLELQGNGLTDLAALHLAKAIEQAGSRNITKLDLSDNKFTSKAGVYIGSALIKNPEYPMYNLTFENVYLGEDGLVRIIEAVNANKNILKLNCGIVTDCGLEILAEKLQTNTSLEEIIFQETEDHQKFWTKQGRGAFTKMMENCTQLKKVKANTKRDDTDEYKDFKEQVKFYTEQKKGCLKKAKDFSGRMASCDQQNMFENMLNNTEDKHNNCEMPARKFYKNTFDDLINLGMFDLQNKRIKFP